MELPRLPMTIYPPPLPRRPPATWGPGTCRFGGLDRPPHPEKDKATHTCTPARTHSSPVCAEPNCTPCRATPLPAVGFRAVCVGRVVPPWSRGSKKKTCVNGRLALPCEGVTARAWCGMGRLGIHRKCSTEMATAPGGGWFLLKEPWGHQGTSARPCTRPRTSVLGWARVRPRRHYIFAGACAYHERGLGGTYAL